MIMNIKRNNSKSYHMIKPLNLYDVFFLFLLKEHCESEGRGHDFFQFPLSLP